MVWHRQKEIYPALSGNKLVYELFFPGELHARKLNLFDETANIQHTTTAYRSWTFLARKSAIGVRAQGYGG